MSALTYNSWNNCITGASLGAFEAVISQSPLLTNLLNVFGGTVRLSNGSNYAKDAYLQYVLERIADHPITRVHEPLPWNVHALFAQTLNAAA